MRSPIRYAVEGKLVREDVPPSRIFGEPDSVCVGCQKPLAIGDHISFVYPERFMSFGKWQHAECAKKVPFRSTPNPEPQ